ncbi:MAG TPA: dihydrofolate reductase family protein [Chitinophagaceae bacterium]|nr:dihydrofolate reductase family protein [Chitinophagaceae bacterium]
MLRTAGVEVKENILEKDCRELNKRFFVFHEQKRPYVILKWAQTADGFIAGNSGQRLLISNEFTNREVHKWRSEEASILVGTNTARLDDPALTNRNWPGPSPLRLVIDMDLSLPSQLKLFDGQQKTIVFNSIKHEEPGNPAYWKIKADMSLVHQVLNALYHMNIQSVLVEGGAKLLQSFIDEDAWDEVRVITNTGLDISNTPLGDGGGNGLAAPRLNQTIKTGETIFLSDKIEFYHST